MKISVIIISYNEKDYLPEAIECCLQQDTFEKGMELEIIIGDDGSSDGSQEIIEQYCKQYPDIVRSFVMERNITGPVIPSFRCSNVIRRGIEEARGEYIQILSGDDRFLQRDKISKAVAFLDQNEEYSCCYTDYRFFWDDGTEKPPKKTKKDQFSRPVLWSFEYRHISCYLFRKSVKHYLLDRFCDDTGLFFSCFLAGKAMHFQDPAFGYRQRDTGIMRTSDRVDLDLLEMLLFQDVQETGKLRRSSLAKFCVPTLRVWKYREKLKEPKYDKYFLAAQQKEGDNITCLRDWEDTSVQEKYTYYSLLVKMVFYRAVFKVLDIIETLVK